jgi:putative peptidoglycan lipid II flippase
MVARPTGRGSGGTAPYAPGVDESDRARERIERLHARNERRRARGKPIWEFETIPPLEDAEPDSRSIADPDQSTMIISRATLRRAAEDEPQRRRLAVSTAIFAVATGLSRVLGLIRQIVVAYYFSAQGRINAFTVAYQLPNLVANLAASSALQSAFVPVFSDLIEKGDRRRAWRVASSLFWLMLLALTALTALLILVAPWIVGIFGNPGHDRSLAVGLSRVMFPLVALLGVSGVVVGILNTYDHFTVPALSPVFWNIAIIAGLAIGVPQQHSANGKLYVYATAVLVATVVQVLLPLPWLRGLDRGEERLRVVLDWRDPAVQRVFKLMIPVALGVGLINVNALIDTFFASRLIDPGLSPAAIQYAFLIYMFPQGMFSVAIATVLFPTLSRLASRRDMAGFGDTVSLGVRQVAFMLVPMAAVSAILCEPIVRILYQHGSKWDSGQTVTVAACLAAFSAGLVFNGWMLMLNRAFFSLQDNWTPTVVALANLFANALLDLAFYRVGTWGIPLSTSVVNVGGTIALAILLRRRLGRGVVGGHIPAALTKIVLACVPVAVVSYVVWKPLDSALGRAFPAQVVSLGAALLAATAAYLAACSLLRVGEMQALLSLRGRLRRA